MAERRKLFLRDTLRVGEVVEAAVVEVVRRGGRVEDLFVVDSFLVDGSHCACRGKRARGEAGARDERSIILKGTMATSVSERLQPGQPRSPIWSGSMHMEHTAPRERWQLQALIVASPSAPEGSQVEGPGLEGMPPRLRNIQDREPNHRIEAARQSGDFAEVKLLRRLPPASSLDGDGDEAQHALAAYYRPH